VDTAFRRKCEDKQIVAMIGTDSVKHSSFQRLLPTKWLNDELINFYMTYLSNRESSLCSKYKKRPTQFFKSFFYTKLVDHGYEGVKTWIRSVPKKNIFNLDKMIFPCCIGDNTHWITTVVDIQNCKIISYDSLGGNYEYVRQTFLYYLKKEHNRFFKTSLPVDKWQLIEAPYPPAQNNGYDCGVFTCVLADFVSLDLPLTYNQTDVDYCRDRLAHIILQHSV